MPGVHLPLWLKIAWTLWVLCWAPVYWKQYGAQNFLFFCDLGNLLILIALWSESPLIFSWQAVSLLLVQSLFAIDLAGALISGHHLFGATEFMFDSGKPLMVRLMSLFHLVTPVVLLWAIWRLGYDRRGWKLQILTLWVVVPINFFWRPEADVNWARGLFFHEQHMLPPLLYLLGYLLVAPLILFYLTHLFLLWYAKKVGAPVMPDAVPSSKYRDQKRL